ncbi:hypothetical protein AFCA_012096 [Aspergillus flavus]|uniref:Unnamed protein product n=2 Tax=Aspergillus oryzae TaxID=5062 RepID=A0AAN4YNN9_ASPOZ|nr:hypothetical protein AFCA_012096 [Aspergillus flavus]GMF76697.1 unnamed protein product [Aspergillus oryzae]GMG42401.1 unnamed protein product [Aspergillus oryzae var. brunneus]GMF84139.1 unnamed protein product [Aspergillus oryzae]GMG01633.1 unnamed protein product [Aspergillus oryzae]
MDRNHLTLLRICERKLDEECSHPDRDLRLVVGHTQILNALLSAPIPISSLVDQHEESAAIQLGAELKAPPESLPMNTLGLLSADRLDYEVLLPSYD